MVALLTSGKDLSTGDIAKAIGRSVPREHILGALRLAELVRYETEGRYARYQRSIGARYGEFSRRFPGL